MKKTALTFAAAALLTLPALASAQQGSTSQTASIQASATVATVLEFSDHVGLSFGSVVPGTAATGTGSIKLSRNVGVTFTLPDADKTGLLTRTGGPETLQPSFTCGTGSTATAITKAFLSCAPATGTESVGTLAAPATSTSEFIVFTGTLAAADTNTTPGTYTGNIRITATAN